MKKVILIILAISTFLSGMGMGAVKLEYIGNSPVLYTIIFITLSVSLAGDAVFFIYNLIKKKKDYSADPRNTLDVMTKALDLACIAMSNGQYNFRANIFIRCNENKDKICIKYHSSNMAEALDKTMSLEKWQGCTGQAWGYNAPIVADLTLPEIQGGASWGLSAKQVEITKELAAILSLPVHPPDDNDATTAILSFDTTEPIADILLGANFIKLASQIASQLGGLLATFGHSELL